MIDRRGFYTVEAEVRFYVPETTEPFMSFGLFSERARCWVPMVFVPSFKRELIAGQAARAADFGFDYWILCLPTDDEAVEIAAWRTLPAPDSAAFRDMLERSVPHGVSAAEEVSDDGPPSLN